MNIVTLLNIIELMMCNACEIDTLDLSGCNIDIIISSIESVFTALIYNRTVKTCSFSGIFMPVGWVYTLAKCLSSDSCCIESLVLKNCGITDKGLESMIAAMCSVNESKIRSIDLTGNTLLTNDSVIHMLEFIESRNQVYHINLDGCTGIDSETKTKFNKVLRPRILNEYNSIAMSISNKMGLLINYINQRNSVNVAFEFRDSS